MIDCEQHLRRAQWLSEAGALSPFCGSGPVFMMTVRDVMTTPVIIVRPDTPLKEVAQVLTLHLISGVPVVDDAGRIVGLISETDLLVKEAGPEAVQHRLLVRFVGESEATEAQLAKVDAIVARDAMTVPALVIDPDRPIHEAAKLMVERRINRLPVVDAQGRLVGIVSRADIVRAFVRPDEDLERTIREKVIVETMWLDPANVELEVANGVVRVRATLDRRSTAEILKRLIGQVDGIVAVQADLAWQLDDSAIERR
jgi:CBS domain-containing protein